MKKKALSLVIMCSLVGTMIAGCGSSSSSGSSAASSTDSEATAAATESAETSGTESATTETASTSTGSGTHTHHLKLFVDETWWPYQSWQGRIPELVEDKLDTDIEVTVAADTNALNMGIASSSLGDLVVSDTFARMADSNVSYDIYELADQYNVQLPFDDVTKFVNTANDGHVYTVQCGYSPDFFMKKYNKAVYEGPGLVLRSDIYQALGSPKIENTDDLESLFAQVKEKYPDVIPFVYNTTHNNNFLKVLCGATTYTSGYVDVDGVAKPFIYDPALKDYYLLMNKWYNAGYMSDENFAFTADDSDKEYMVSGKIFADSKYSDTKSEMDKALNEAGVTDYNTIQVYDILNTQPGAKFKFSSVGWRGIYIPKSCTDPEAAIKFLNFCYSQEGMHLILWGEEGKDWNWSDDKSYPVLNYDWDSPNTDDGMKYWGWMTHDGVANTLPSAGDKSDTYAARKALTAVTESNPVLAMIRLDPDSEEATIMANLTDLEKNSAVSIITAGSQEEAEAAYDEMISTADSLGGQKLIDYAKDLYTEKKAEYDKINASVTE